ncbi:glutamine-hydrolyzing GMP synthase [Blattabacterium cuenoti]|uniref:glutamine-hydrolyzing GMP synthase n=1 Tax=Blattabacterium cuenoti TaxID=1653831 RepID=UPI00163BF54F|nr:glutamine-hydrolyzing GMP synthase [Blattabacterium cuenoti]
MKKNFILILDFGSQYSYLIARRIREMGVYTDFLQSNVISLSKILSNKPNGIILSGGPLSVYDNSAMIINKDIFKLDIPIFGICYGMQLISHIFGGKVEKSKIKEYGKSHLIIDSYSKIFHGIQKKSIVWMSHFDEVTKIPKEFTIVGHTEYCAIAALVHTTKDIYAVQFHPEVKNTEFGRTILKNFVVRICKCSQNWVLDNFVKKSVHNIRKRVLKKQVILGLSGGLDSFVTAIIIHKAIGKSLNCLFIDTGLFLNKEKDRIFSLCKESNLPIKIIDARDRFLSKLTGISDPEKKRKIIGKEFISIFQEESEKIMDAEFLAQGTIYSDIIESSSKNGFSSIKSHHNVGGLPNKLMKLKLIEPLKKLFKDEVKKIGVQLGLPNEILKRHPFPGPGLGIRIIGKINKKKILILKKAEDILMQELIKNNLYNSVSQAFIVLLPIKSVGIMGDKRTYEYSAVLRVTHTEDFMTATVSHLSYNFLEKISNRIINEVDGINRMLYDITSKPPSTIEWE